MKILFQRGNRLFTGMWLFLILGAVGHMAADLKAFSDDVEFTTLIEAMEGYTIETGTPMNPTVMQVFTSVWMEVGGLMILVATLNLVVTVATQGDRKVRRALVITNFLFFAPLTVLFVILPMVPPLIIYGLLSMLLAIEFSLSLRESP